MLDSTKIRLVVSSAPERVGAVEFHKVDLGLHAVTNKVDHTHPQLAVSLEMLLPEEACTHAAVVGIAFA